MEGTVAIQHPIEGTDCFIEEVERVGESCSVWRVHLPECCYCCKPGFFEATGTRQHAESFAHNPEYLVCEPCSKYAMRTVQVYGGEG